MCRQGEQETAERLGSNPTRDWEAEDWLMVYVMRCGCHILCPPSPFFLFAKWCFEPFTHTGDFFPWSSKGPVLRHANIKVTRCLNGPVLYLVGVVRSEALPYVYPVERRQILQKEQCKRSDIYTSMLTHGWLPVLDVLVAYIRPPHYHAHVVKPVNCGCYADATTTVWSIFPTLFTVTF